MSGLKRWIACLTAGRKASTSARCRWVLWQANTFHLHRKFTRARHNWLSLKPDWHLLAAHMCTEWPGKHSEEINDRLFANPGRNDTIQDTQSKAKWHSLADWRWLGQRDHVWQLVDARVAPVVITVEKTFAEYRANLRVDCKTFSSSWEEEMEDQRWDLSTERSSTF